MTYYENIKESIFYLFLLGIEWFFLLKLTQDKLLSINFQCNRSRAATPMIIITVQNRHITFSSV